MIKNYNLGSIFTLSLLTLVTSVLALLSGCVAPVGGNSTPDAPVHTGQPVAVDGRVIVKFRKGIDPTNAQFIGNLSEGLGVALRYLHPLSGDAHLLQAQGLKDATQLAHVVTQLNRRPEVVYAEADVRVRHQ